MNRIITLSVLFTLFLLKSTAQTFQHAGEYMDYIAKANQALSEKYISYLSGVSHGKSARKVEKRRQEVLSSIYETRITIQGMPPYKGDKSLRDSAVAYYKLLNHVFNEEYGKILNLEEIAEESYDAMEAYMLAQKRAQEKLELATKAQQEIEKDFAGRHNVNLIESASTLSNKMKIAGAVMDHYDEVYLVFFKSYKQEGHLLDAVNRKDILGIEQNMNSLQTFAEEGLEKLKSIKGYGGDNSIVIACRNILLFYKSEARQAKGYTDYYLKTDNFEKIKKAFEKGKRTKQSVDEYNAAVKDINAAVNDYNKLNNQLNDQRSKELKSWNTTVSKYLDTYMPMRK